MRISLIGESLDRQPTVDDCKLVDLKRISSPQGNLTPVYPGQDVPFQIARVYYLYDVPGGATRAGHAHWELEQLIVAAMGSFDVVLDDGSNRKTAKLNRAYSGLYVPNLIWREIVDFSSGGICLVFASKIYVERDYIRDYAEFLRVRKQKRV
jgi:hypothetical protein